VRKMTNFWDITPCSLAEAVLRFGDPYCIHHAYYRLDYGLTDWLRWGETDVSEPRPSLAYCSCPGWMWVESRGGHDAGWLVYYSSLAVLPTETSERGGMDERMIILRIQYLWCINGSLTRRKILRHRNSSFTSHPRGRCAADFYRP
jgi:hypothetical protein